LKKGKRMTVLGARVGDVLLKGKSKKLIRPGIERTEEKREKILVGEGRGAKNFSLGEKGAERSANLT